MIKHISFPSIEQYRNIVATLHRQFNFVGLDEQGEAIYDPSKPKPTLTFKGTVKLHGTNAGVCYNLVDGLWAQSRENVITPIPQQHYEVEFEDGSRKRFETTEIIDGKSIGDYNTGDVIQL